jgi:hypothetical protein
MYNYNLNLKVSKKKCSIFFVGQTGLFECRSFKCHKKLTIEKLANSQSIPSNDVALQNPRTLVVSVSLTINALRWQQKQAKKPEYSVTDMQAWKSINRVNIKVMAI